MNEPLNIEVFARCMEAVAKAVGEDWTEARTRIFYERFKSWPDREFVMSMGVCADELRRLPKFADVIMRRPPVENDAPTVNCETCKDDGSFQVYCSQYYKPILNGTHSEPLLYESLTIGCSECKLGKWKIDRQGYQHFRPAMFVMRTMDDDEIERFKAFVQTRRHAKFV